MPPFESKRRRKVLRLMKQYRALLILSKSITRSDLAEFDSIIAACPTFTAKQLIRAETFYEEQMRNVAEQVGLIADTNDLVRVIERWPMKPPYIAFASKHDIDTRWFRNFGSGRFPGWSEFPPHTRIGIDLEGDPDHLHNLLEWRLLEAALFEDMALLWNDVVANRHHELGADYLVHDARIPPKRLNILTRSTVRAAFALLEGYANGIAVDLLLTRDDLTAAERDLLDETRGDTKRFSPVSLRDKLLKYPRIALRREHPVFNETDFPAMADVCQFERQHRDSLMHPTPKFEVGRAIPREEVFYEISIDDTRKIIDAVVEVIERIDKEFDGIFGRVSTWVVKRGSDDRYPNTTFH